MARCGEISLTRLPRATAPRVQQGVIRLPQPVGLYLTPRQTGDLARDGCWAWATRCWVIQLPPRSLCNAKSANEASPRQPGSSIRRRRGISSPCASLAHPPWLRTPDLQGRRARRMPWESFAVGGPDEAREFWTAAVSDARALPPGGRDGLGGDAGARARARAVAADPSRGRDDRPL